MSQSSPSIGSLPPKTTDSEVSDRQMLPVSPSLVFLKREARTLRSDFKSGEANAFNRVNAILDQQPDRLTQSRALLVVAREHGFSSWPSLKAYVDDLRSGGPASLQPVENTMTKQIGYDRRLDDLLSEATELLQAHANGDAEALSRIRSYHPEYSNTTNDDIAGSTFDEHAAQLVVAREYGFATWGQLKVFVGTEHTENTEYSFESLACLVYDQSDRPSNWQRARDLLTENPELATANIWAAACAGNADAVRDFLKEDPSLVHQRGGYFDWEPLLYACYSRLGKGSTLEVARVLIDAGADANAHYMWAGQYRFTALTGAFGEGEMGPVNQPEHEACTELATLLLEAGAHPNDSQALYNRMFTKGTSVLELLLKYGLATNDRNNWLLEEDGKLVEHPEETLFYQLRFAIDNHHVERARLLIDHGTKLDDIPETGQSLYEVALLRGHPDLADYMVEKGARKPELSNVDQFVSAMAAGDKSVAQTLLDSDADLVRQTEEKYPSLVIDAAASNQLDAVRTMADMGFSVDRLTHRAPLHEAAWSDHLEMVKLLIERGADLGVRDQHHAATPLQFAQTAGNPDLAEYIATCDVDVFDAVAGNNEERLRSLIADNATLLEASFRSFRQDDDAHPLDWQTPLAFAATRGQIEMTRVLISLGANTGVSNDDGRTLIDIVRDRDNKEVTEALEQGGAA
ncbi:MAG: ankyrin repeat domain-containing protein [Pseudomonadota bacterium]